MLTDCVDGWLAKRLGQCTSLGLYLDPVVDKVVILVLLYELARGRLIHGAVPHLFLARELLQNGVRAAAAARGTVVGANWMGKSKACLQTALVAWGLMMPGLAVRLPAAGKRLAGALDVSAWAVLGLAWCFFAVFVYRNRRLFADR